MLLSQFIHWQFEKNDTDIVESIKKERYQIHNLDTAQ